MLNDVGNEGIVIGFLYQALEFYDILKGAKGLLKKTECQSHLLKNLEFKYPGIAEENKQEGTAYIISEDEISSLESLVDKYSAL